MRATAAAHERSFLKVSRQLFNAQKSEALKNLPKVAKAFTDATTKDARTKALADLFDMKGNIKRFAAAFQPVYQDTMKDAGKNAMRLVSTDNFDYEDPAVRQYFTTRAQLVSVGINEETDKQLKATINQGLNAGEGIDELTTRVEGIYGSAAGYRAERIARTETISASTAAADSAWQQSGVVSGKEWYTARDERVCPFCEDMDGTIIDLGENFFDQGDTQTVTTADGKELENNQDYADVPGPPDHSNCRCTLLPVVN
jgi:SPP1 gp7 family putative phage head morphogenesis protein